MLRITVLEVVEAASLLITNDQVTEPHQAGRVTAKSVKWFVVNDIYGCHQILITVVVT